MKKANRSTTGTAAPLRPFLGGIVIGLCLCNVGSILNSYLVFLKPESSLSSYQQTQEPSTPPPPPPPPTAAERWLHYSQTYRYISPASRDDYAQPVPIPPCGKFPDYAPWFQLDLKERSRLNEDKIIYDLLFKNSTTQRRRNGGESTTARTYLELGAFNGKQESNTRFFDDCLGWTGLLIEANPGIYQRTIEHRPFAHKMSFAPSCAADSGVSNTTVPFHRVPWTNGGMQGYALAYNNSKARPTVDVPCGPLSPVLADIFAVHEDPPPQHRDDPNHHPTNTTTNMTTTPVLRLPTLDFFSLDVEGAEALVLSTIDFHAVRIHVLMIEIRNSFCQDNTCQVRQDVRAKMAREGYHRYEGVVKASDVYVHPDSPYQISDTVATPK